MNERTRAYLHDLTSRARAAFAGVPQDEIEQSVDAAMAEVRQEMTNEFARTDELAQARDRNPQPV